MGFRARVDRLTLAAAGLIGVAYVVYFVSLSPPPFQDLPNHLARATIIADALFDGGARYGSMFGVHLLPVSYVLHDLLFALLIAAFGPTTGTSIFVAIVLLSLPAAVWFYMRVMQIAPRSRLVPLLLSLVLATDWFFLMGFMAFRLAVAFVVVSVAMAELLRRSWSGARYGMYVAVLVAGYLTHLTAPVFALVIVTITALFRLYIRRTIVLREVQLLLPIVLLLGFHLAVTRHTDVATPAAFQYDWGRLGDKLFYWSYELDRFGGHSAQLLMALFAACILIGIRRAIARSSLTAPPVVESFLIALAFLGVYILLPRTYSDSGYVDVRALVMITLYLLIAALWLVQMNGGRGFDSVTVRMLALLLSALNLGWIAWKMAPLEAWLVHYRQIAAAVPDGARVLPISTRRKVGGFSPFLHAGSFLVVDRRALIPYLFSGNHGDPMKYFYYRAGPYTPQENWYTEQLKWRSATPATYTILGQNYTWRYQYSDRDRTWEPLKLVPIEWGPVACSYEWLLVARPYLHELIGVPAQLVRENDAAALLRVDKSACRPAPARPVHLASEH